MLGCVLTGGLASMRVGVTADGMAPTFTGELAGVAANCVRV